MGLLVDNGPFGFVGAARVLATASPDTMLLAVGISLRNRGLTFRREGDEFVAEYAVEVTLRAAEGIAARAGRDERVRVATFRETQRTDESIIFQELLRVASGQYALTVSVRDRNSTNSGRAEAQVLVPQLRPSSVSLPISVYRAAPRSALEQAPNLVMNPRHAVEYGGDSAYFYVETYGMAPGARFVLSAVEASGSGRVDWSDTVIADSGRVHGMVKAVPPAALSIGRYDLQLSQGDVVMASTPLLVAFSEHYAVANLEDIVSLLRYFPNADSLRGILSAPPEERGARWRSFWRASDPVATTPENEAIDEYLRRVRIANERFNDEGGPGWLTDRGEVFITLGDPTNVYDRRSDVVGRGRYIIWEYYDYRLTLNFVDDTGFGRFRLEPRSRAEFQRVRNQTRSR